MKLKIETVYCVVFPGDRKETLSGVYLNLGHALRRQEQLTRDLGEVPEIRVFAFTGETEHPDGRRVKSAEVDHNAPEYNPAPEYGRVIPFKESVCGLELDKRW